MKKTQEIKLYGNISEDNYNCAAAMIGEIDYYKSQGMDIVIRIHSTGGNVIEGNAIAAAPNQ